MNNIWFTSDTHYHHKNIVRGTSSWNTYEEGSSHQNTRNFDTLEEHDEVLVQNINSLVKENDILYHLGDWSFGGIEQIWNFRKQIRCKTIHLIFGNHDTHIENNKALPNVCKEGSVINSSNGRTDNRVLIDCKFEDYRSWGFLKAKELFTSTQHYKEISIGKQKIILFHFAMRVWNKSHRNSILLYGHSHNTISNDYGKSMDIGVDAHPEFRPFAWEEIKEIMDKREPLMVDHHNQNTN